jgi:hypothetical protein
VSGCLATTADHRGNCIIVFQPSKIVASSGRADQTFCEEPKILTNYQQQTQTAVETG